MSSCRSTVAPRPTSVSVSVHLRVDEKVENMAKVFRFRCDVDRQLVAYTYDNAAANLPPDECQGDWKPTGEIEVQPGEYPKVMGTDQKALKKDLDEKGFDLVRFTVQEA